MPAFQTSHLKRLVLVLFHFVNLHKVIFLKGYKLHRLKLASIYVAVVVAG
jgi:hypothetical protein